MELFTMQFSPASRLSLTLNQFVMNSFINHQQELITWSKALEKLTVANAVNIFLAPYETKKSVLPISQNISTGY
jgi:hypothetical protein